MGILDNSHATAMGTKVGIPVTTVLETDPCIFTNYNGAGPRPQDCGTLRFELAISGRSLMDEQDTVLSGHKTGEEGFACGRCKCPFAISFLLRLAWKDD